MQNKTRRRKHILYEEEKKLNTVKSKIKKKQTKSNNKKYLIFKIYNVQNYNKKIEEIGSRRKKKNKLTSK